MGPKGRSDKECWFYSASECVVMTGPVQAELYAPYFNVFILKLLKSVAL